MNLDNCYICYEPASSKDPLKSPCKCKGSMAWIHQSCLMSWLRTTDRDYCQHCLWKYQANKPRPQEAYFLEESCAWLKRLMKNVMLLILSGVVALWCGHSFFFIGGTFLKVLFGLYLVICGIMILPIIMKWRMFRQAYVQTQHIMLGIPSTNETIHKIFWWLMFLLNIVLVHQLNHKNNNREDWLAYIKSIPDVEK